MIRAIVLVLLGVFLSSLRHQQTHWEFPNVLAQIGLGYVFVFAVVRWKWWGQVAAIAAILIANWTAFYLHVPPENYDFAAVKASAEMGEVLDPPFRQWSKNGNFVHEVDVKFLNQLPRLRTKKESRSRLRSTGRLPDAQFLPIDRHDDPRSAVRAGAATTGLALETGWHAPGDCGALFCAGNGGQRVGVPHCEADLDAIVGAVQRRICGVDAGVVFCAV